LAAQHFQKIECFCFNRQAFKPGEGKDMPLAFRLDPALAPEISTVTLSYTFFKVEDQGG
jgi:cytochrome c oxidase assembly protein subunit 11